MAQQMMLSSFSKKKTGKSDSQKSQSASVTDKASFEASGSEPPAKKSKSSTPRGF